MSPGTKVIAATSNYVRVYNATNGDFIAPLKGHKDAVYCVCYNRDGSRFASGAVTFVIDSFSVRLFSFITRKFV